MSSTEPTLSSGGRVLLAVLAIGFVVLLVAAAEFLLRGAGLGTPIVYDGSKLWGYTPQPGQSVERFGGARITIDDAGLRVSPDLDPSRPGRVVFLGDSITYGGSYIDDKDLFSSIACSASSQFSCWNAGVNGWGVMNAVARSRFDERLPAPQVIVFTFITGDFYRGLVPSNAAHFMLRQPNQLVPALHEALNFIATRYSPKKYLGKCCGRPLTPEEERNEQRLAMTWAFELLGDEIRRLEEAGRTVLLAHSPDRASFETGEQDEMTDYLFELADRAGIEILDLLVPLKRSGLTADEIYYDKVHYDAAGHRVVGEFFKARLHDR
ncbi:MAG: SGNH/GDSL hydrolase family protein [Gammaproteobacteria bacterium]|nr:SGNH/GDSL hydrolase family protein [Gammaproteobacteria bacterium]